MALPIILLALVVRIFWRCTTGSNNPDGIDIKKNKDERCASRRHSLPVLPCDLVPKLVVFFMVFAPLCSSSPKWAATSLKRRTSGGEPTVVAGSYCAGLLTAPYYSILVVTTADGRADGRVLRSCSCCRGSTARRCAPCATRHHQRWGVLVFAAAFIILGVLGAKAPTPVAPAAGICTVIYFGFIGMFFWSNTRRLKAGARRVTVNGGLGPWKTLGAVAFVFC